MRFTYCGKKVREKVIITVQTINLRYRKSNVNKEQSIRIPNGIVATIKGMEYLVKVKSVE